MAQTTSVLNGVAEGGFAPPIGRGISTDQKARARTKADTRGLIAQAIVTLVLLAASIQPALAQHRARMSEDLADHLVSGS